LATFFNIRLLRQPLFYFAGSMKFNFSSGLVIHILFFLTGCVYHSLPDEELCDMKPVLLTVVSVEHADCGLQNGSFQVVASGGTEKFLYRVGNGLFRSTPTFSNLGAGSYEVAASDENNCADVIQVVIQNKNGLLLTVTTGNSGCEKSTGSITAMASNGVEPYEFSLDGGTFQPDSTFTSLSQGQYTLRAKDATGCETSQTVTVFAGTSFENEISPIISGNCAVNGCHNGTQFPDLRTFTSIRANALRIKEQTQSRNMPQGGRTLSQAQIDAIGCWVDDGAPNN